ncbi:MAG: replication-associated recombination protein A [Streptococcaceae bacterium]|jgi:putative ATPase|nr:replication-associated recombination protein A [Streptococcaceae bacterium]
MQEPLAYRMRPRVFNEIVGQQHLVGEGKIIARMLAAKRLYSMILYGPPGVGKTSIANAIANSIEYAFRKLNAAINTKKDLQIIVDEAHFSGKVILLLDEIHRLDKIKQDFLLPHLESGKIILIGSTTQNPYFAIQPAMRSRMQIFEVLPLSEKEIKQAIKVALKDKERGLGNFNVKLTKKALQCLTQTSNGDLRSALNGLEIATLSTFPNLKGEIVINLEVMKESIQRKVFAYEKDADMHYDLISALQKSIRGSDVDASLHYAARLMEAGDLSILMRRLLVIAYEDIGLANPNAVERAVLGVQTAEKLGLPEARISLSNVIIDLSLSPKSNSAYLAIDQALLDVRKGKGGRIPDHIRDTHYQGSKKLGCRLSYQYPHDYQNAWVNQEYLPETLQKTEYYRAKQTGKYEQALALRHQQLKKWKKC